MTAQASIPLKWYVPFANGDSSRVELPVTTADPTRASQTLGFPPLTMQPPESGGVPPQGEDFNGGMNQVARITWWTLNGGGWPFDATFATNSNINGYPNGALIQSADFRGYWLNTLDNNQTNPDTVGTGWVPAFQYGSTAVATTGGTTTLTPAQASKLGLSFTGVLASNATIIVPNWIKSWDVTNSTTGAFALTVKTVAGSGIVIPQNGTTTAVAGDGTNVTQSSRNIATATTASQAARFDQTSGRLLRVTTITSTGTFASGTGTTAVKVRLVGGGGSGGGCVATGASQVSAGSGGSAGAYSEGYFTTGFSGVTVTIGAGGAAFSGTGNNPGAASSFGALMTCPGGLGGSSGGPTTAPFLTGIGATSVATGSGYLKAGGTAGGTSIAVTAGIGFGAFGGSSVFGAGGGSSSPGAAGQAAVAPGAGGGGVMQAASGGALASGAGAGGICIIEEYGSF